MSPGPEALALASAACFGIALVTARVGLRHCDARAGAAISIPAATLLLLAMAPFALDCSGFDARAALVFAGVGLFFPALVTLLTFRANRLLGPTVTGAVSGTSPLFALLAGALLLGERVPAEAGLAAAGVAAGIALLSWRADPATRPGPPGAALLWPLAGAAVRGLAQVGAKAGLLLWASPLAAGLIGYLVSSGAVLAADRWRPRNPSRGAGRGAAWFAATGLLNGTAVLSMYGALAQAPVWAVAPLVACYPLVTAVAGAAVLPEEKFSPRRLAGCALTVAAIGFLLGSL